MSVHKELIELDSIVSQALNLNISALAGKDLNLSVAIDSDVPLQINTDTQRLVQVLSNLLNNAIKFTERGKVALSVSLTDDIGQLTDANSSTILFKIKDTGIGIEKAKQAGLFEAFKQADESMTRVYGGTGLGLSICQHIAQLLGGSISIDSTLGKGAEFTFALPIERSNILTGEMNFSSNVLTHFQPEFSASTLVNLSVNIPQKLRDNLSHIDQGIIDIKSITTLKTINTKAKIILFVNSSDYPQGFTEATLAIIQKEVAVLALCQPVASIIPYQLLEQLNQHDVNYLLLEMPLYRDVIAKLAKELGREQSNDALTSVLPNVEVIKPSIASLTGLNILLVEDNLVNQLVAIKLLESMQAKVTLAQNGQEALDILALHSFDIILMDIQMPIMDGLTASQHIRAQQRYNKLPIIAMTAHAREEDKQQCLAAGMDLHISKPISLNVLRESILSQIHRHDL